jgi:hypothetical protein
MKNLLNKISEEEKNRILEMHSGKKNVIRESDDESGYENLENKKPSNVKYLKNEKISVFRKKKKDADPRTIFPPSNLSSWQVRI